MQNMTGIFILFIFNYFKINFSLMGGICNIGKDNYNKHENVFLENGQVLVERKNVIYNIHSLDR
jgi:hypothetical protein